MQAQGLIPELPVQGVGLSGSLRSSMTWAGSGGPGSGSSDASPQPLLPGDSLEQAPRSAWAAQG